MDGEEEMVEEEEEMVEEERGQKVGMGKGEYVLGISLLQQGRPKLSGARRGDEHQPVAHWKHKKSNQQFLLGLHELTRIVCVGSLYLCCILIFLLVFVFVCVCTCG